ncbi:Pyridoxal phosphate biosynthetic protein PdxA [alpha proteobacterium HIMB59]|nr:Pyridoxal phosphate biosynthetic protein PdxA [alpha proteobacterium HIMB59]
MKKKFIFVGDLDSINLELVCKSHKFLKNKVKYILLGNIREILIYLNKINSELKIQEIINPINFKEYNKNFLNVFNIENISKEKFKNLQNQIHISNYLSNTTHLDLVTLPINKSIFKKKINFTGMTEYLSKLNKKNTKMLMHGEKFSVIPITTHINLKDVIKSVKRKTIKKSLDQIIKQIDRKIYDFNFKIIKFLCYNPHCSEGGTIGLEDKVIKESIANIAKIKGPFAADSAFKELEDQTLYLSMYHDQALIPFKILNKKGINITLGLDYRRLSPAHGTAKDIKFKNKADISSFIRCMQF